jgi:ABC-2 type transport system ATP-binding protein
MEQTAHSAATQGGDASEGAAGPGLAVETRALTKIYGGRDATGKRALDAVDLAVPRGSIFGLLGPNGAGKSTLINILAGLVVKTGGTARIWGHDIDTDTRAARAAIGVVPQELNLDSFFTPREAMEQQAGFYAVPKRERRTMEILEAVGLADKADAYARSLSGGMRRRLLVAKALVHNPPVLVLDEPTAGVDVELRRSLWAYVRRLNENGATILLTTHYLEEAEALCDRIAIIDHGRVIACEPTPDLLKRLEQRTVTVTLASEPPGAPTGALAALAPERTGPHRLVFRFSGRDSGIPAILAALQEAGLAIADLATEETDLEDIFLSLTAGDGEDGGRREARDPMAGTVAVARARPDP